MIQEFSVDDGDAAEAGHEGHPGRTLAAELGVQVAGPEAVLVALALQCGDRQAGLSGIALHGGVEHRCIEQVTSTDAATLFAEEARQLGDVVNVQGQSPAEEGLSGIVTVATGGARGGAQAERAEHVRPQ